MLQNENIKKDIKNCLQATEPKNKTNQFKKVKLTRIILKKVIKHL